MELVFMREQARMAKDWAGADSLRDRLSAMGVQLFDKTGTWRAADGRTGRIPTWSELESGQVPVPAPNPQQPVYMDGAAPQELSGAEAQIRHLIQLREKARASKDWAQSDAIRDQLKALGVDIFDKEKLWKSKDGLQGVIIGYRGPSGASDLEIATLVVQREKARQNSDFATADMIRTELRSVGVDVNDKEKMWRCNDGRTGQVPSWAAITGTAEAPLAPLAPPPAAPLMMPQPTMVGQVTGTLRDQVVQAALAAAQSPAGAARTLQLLQQATVAPPKPVPMPTPASPATSARLIPEVREALNFISLSQSSGRHVSDAEINWLVEMRERMRQNKDFASADEIRNALRSALGVELYEKEKRWVSSDGRQGSIPMWDNLSAS